MSVRVLNNTHKADANILSPASFILSLSQTGVSIFSPADAAAGLGGSVGLPLSCCHGGGCSDAAARRA